MVRTIIGIILSYLVGSIPTAYIFGRISKGIDIRNFGSGNMGATNALRVLGKRIGITVLLLDIIKGLFAVIILGDFIGPVTAISDTSIVPITMAVATIAGHNWTVFLNFRGGKGVATTFGALIGLSFKIPGFAAVLGLTVLVWFTTFFVVRIVSIASVISALMFPIFILLFRHSQNFAFSLICFSFIAAALIWIRHLPNLKRVIQGKEPRLRMNIKK
ncbi:MAG: glycerol-3-phosphate 1-O-acyltransferase PlsY [Candidatus Omnitrophica bacterium]|nr:glycerol-3-phosphate 1-O-acyltransferase PlsY [Candidatus Omnitrophota bacterium]